MSASFIISIIAVILTVLVIRQEIRISISRLRAAILRKSYINESNGFQTLMCVISGIFWVIAYYV